MAQLVMLVLDNAGLCYDVMNAWSEAGARGMTLLESIGLQRLRAAWDDLPLMPSLRDLIPCEEVRQRTLFTVVPDEETVDRIVAATERVVGDLNQEHTGILFVLPVARVVGVRKMGQPRGGA